MNWQHVLGCIGQQPLHISYGFGDACLHANVNIFSNFAVVTEQLSNMPIPEMREVDAHLLSGIPDGTHAPHAREAKLREISSIPTRHNKSISENAKPGQVLHEKVRFRLPII